MVFLLVLVAPGTHGTQTPETGVVVRPGSVVRWTGPGTEACAQGDERWEPLGETCWYPVDLLRGEGPLEVVRWRQGRRERLEIQVGTYPYPVQEIEIADERLVTPSPEDLARIRREQRRVAALWQLRTPRRFTLPLSPPLDPLPEGGRFGARRIFNRQPRNPHTGADYPAAQGTPVRAVADGRVVLAEEHFFAGKSVFLDHGDGLISMYFHLREILVKAGEEIRRGTEIGRVGQTGRATAPHLHFGLRWRGARIDPALLLGGLQEVPEIGR